MTRGSKILLATLVALYLAFLWWYGGRGKPMSPAEADAIFAKITERAGNDANPKLREELRRLADHDDGSEYFMVNLIRFRSKALYPDGAKDEHGAPYGDDPLEADARYNRAIAPYLLGHGNIPVFIARPQGRFIDEDTDTQWDRVAIVRYRSRRDMLEMVAELAGQSVAIHKWASIEKTQVFPVASPFNLVFARGAVAALMLLLSAPIFWLLQRQSARGERARRIAPAVPA